MKTSAIVHRVADFLKDIPPFCFLDMGVLQTIAGSGRVRFHERDEILYSANDSCDEQLRVIQQGTVRLTRLEAGGERVVDLLGAGDLVGLDRCQGRAGCEHTAATMSDTVIYALNSKLFLQACSESPQASRFLQTHFAAAQDGAKSLELDSPAQRLTAASISTRNFAACEAGNSMQAAISIMRERAMDELLVTDAQGFPAGCLTSEGVREYALARPSSDGAKVAQFMGEPPPTAPPDASLNDCLLAMARAPRRRLCVTADGSPASAAVGFLTERDLLLWTGSNPTVVISALGAEDNLQELAKIRRRIDDLIEGGLSGFQNVGWHSALATEANRTLLLHLLALAEKAASAATGKLAPAGYCLAFVGAAGRGELMTFSEIETILILEDSAANDEAWFAVLGEKFAALMAECGFAAPRSLFFPGNPDCRSTLDGWAAKFRGWIFAPIENDIQRFLPLFDFSPAQPGHPLALALRQKVREALAHSPHFIRLMANDCFENLPPLTILDGCAIDAEGAQTEELDIHSHALRPVADVARVFQLASGDIAATSTLDRLALAGKRQPGTRQIFEQAARAFRIALACSARVGLKSRSDGRFIRPSLLPRADQLLLKSGFQSIAALLEYSAHAHGFRR